MIPEARTKREKPAWWNYVKKVIREYPELRRRMETPLEPRVTGSAGIRYKTTGADGETEEGVLFGGYGSGGTSSPVEKCVIHDLPPKEQRRFEAVDTAIQETKALHPDDWEPRMGIIDLVYFRGTHTIAGAAMQVGCHENTAGKWQAEFIRLVAEELDLP